MRGTHHLHVRKRMSRNLEPYPARTSWKRLLDRTVLTVGILGPLTTIPQIVKIYVLQSAAGVSSVTWGLCALLDIPWIIYGLAHKERPITITYVLWFFANLAVFAGTLLYSGHYF